MGSTYLEPSYSTYVDLPGPPFVSPLTTLDYQPYMNTHHFFAGPQQNFDQGVYTSSQVMMSLFND